MVDFDSLHEWLRVIFPHFVPSIQIPFVSFCLLFFLLQNGESFAVAFALGGKKWEIISWPQDEVFGEYSEMVIAITFRQSFHWGKDEFPLYVNRLSDCLSFVISVNWSGGSAVGASYLTHHHTARQCLFLLKVAAETVAVAAAETGWQLSQSLPCFVNQFSSSPLNFSITQTTHVLFEVRLLHILIRIRPLDFRFLMAFSMYVHMYITFDWCRTLQQTITSKKAVTSHPCCEYFHFFFSPTHTHALTPSFCFFPFARFNFDLPYLCCGCLFRRRRRCLRSAMMNRCRGEECEAAVPPVFPV